MGVDYRVWIIPKQRAFLPSSDLAANLANALRDDNWVPKAEADGQHSQVLELFPGQDGVSKKPAHAQLFDAAPFTPGWVEFHRQHELVLDWHVHNMVAAGVKYPFTFDPYADSGSVPYFYIRIILGRDYFYWNGENVMPFPEELTKCTCGEHLAYWTGWAHGVGSERIHKTCPKCNKNFDPSDIACDVLDEWTGVPAPLVGGLTFRFALVVDCHKYWPHDEEGRRRFKLRPEFLDLWETHVGVPYEIVITMD